MAPRLLELMGLLLGTSSLASLPPPLHERLLTVTTGNMRLVASCSSCTSSGSWSQVGERPFSCAREGTDPLAMSSLQKRQHQKLSSCLS